jgi:hypothetical protein
LLSTRGNCASPRPIPNGRTRSVSRTGRCAAAGLCEAFGWWAGGAVTCRVAGVLTAGACVAALETLDAGVVDDETDGDPLCGADEPDEGSLGWLDAELDAGCGAGELLAEVGCACGAASGKALADELAGAG